MRRQEKGRGGRGGGRSEGDDGAEGEGKGLTGRREECWRPAAADLAWEGPGLAERGRGGGGGPPLYRRCGGN